MIDVNSVVLSSRIRLARSLKNYVFPSCLVGEDGYNVIKEVADVTIYAIELDKYDNEPQPSVCSYRSSPNIFSLFPLFFCFANLVYQMSNAVIFNT